jgi:Family of unknown function (DUF6157)
MRTTNLPNSFIAIAEDCPVFMAEIPPAREPKSIPQIEYEMLADQPYKYTSDDVLYAANGERRGITREDFFAKIQPDFRLSPLTKRYGWGVHSDENGKIAVYAVSSAEYEILVGNKTLTQLKANRSKRRRSSRMTSPRHFSRD